MQFSQIIDKDLFTQQPKRNHATWK